MNYSIIPISTTTNMPSHVQPSIPIRVNQHIAPMVASSGLSSSYTIRTPVISQRGLSPTLINSVPQPVSHTAIRVSPLRNQPTLTSSSNNIIAAPPIGPAKRGLSPVFSNSQAQPSTIIINQGPPGHRRISSTIINADPYVEATYIQPQFNYLMPQSNLAQSEKRSPHKGQDFRGAQTTSQKVERRNPITKEIIVSSEDYFEMLKKNTATAGQSHKEKKRENYYDYKHQSNQTNYVNPPVSMKAPLNSQIPSRNENLINRIEEALKTANGNLAAGGKSSYVFSTGPASNSGSIDIPSGYSVGGGGVNTLYLPSASFTPNTSIQASSSFIRDSNKHGEKLKPTVMYDKMEDIPLYQSTFFQYDQTANHRRVKSSINSFIEPQVRLTPTKGIQYSPYSRVDLVSNNLEIPLMPLRQDSPGRESTNMMFTIPNSNPVIRKALTPPRVMISAGQINPSVIVLPPIVIKDPPIIIKKNRNELSDVSMDTEAIHRCLDFSSNKSSLILGLDNNDNTPFSYDNFPIITPKFEQFNNHLNQRSAGTDLHLNSSSSKSGHFTKNEFEIDARNLYNPFKAEVTSVPTNSAKKQINEQTKEPFMELVDNRVQIRNKIEGRNFSGRGDWEQSMSNHYKKVQPTASNYAGYKREEDARIREEPIVTHHFRNQSQFKESPQISSNRPNASETYSSSYNLKAYLPFSQDQQIFHRGSSDKKPSDHFLNSSDQVPSSNILKTSLHKKAVSSLEAPFKANPIKDLNYENKSREPISKFPPIDSQNETRIRNYWETNPTGQKYENSYSKSQSNSATKEQNYSNIYSSDKLENSNQKTTKDSQVLGRIVSDQIRDLPTYNIYKTLDIVLSEERELSKATYKKEETRKPETRTLEGYNQTKNERDSLFNGKPSTSDKEGLGTGSLLNNKADSLSSNPEILNNNMQMKNKFRVEEKKARVFKPQSYNIEKPQVKGQISSDISSKSKLQGVVSDASNFEKVPVNTKDLLNKADSQSYDPNKLINEKRKTGGLSLDMNIFDKDLGSKKEENLRKDDYSRADKRPSQNDRISDIHKGFVLASSSNVDYNFMTLKSQGELEADELQEKLSRGFNTPEPALFDLDYYGKGKLTRSSEKKEVAKNIEILLNQSGQVNLATSTIIRPHENEDMKLVQRLLGEDPETDIIKGINSNVKKEKSKHILIEELELEEEDYNNQDHARTIESLSEKKTGITPIKKENNENLTECTPKKPDVDTRTWEEIHESSVLRSQRLSQDLQAARELIKSIEASNKTIRADSMSFIKEGHMNEGHRQSDDFKLEKKPEWSVNTEGSEILAKNKANEKSIYPFENNDFEAELKNQEPSRNLTDRFDGEFKTFIDINKGQEVSKAGGNSSENKERSNLIIRDVNDSVEIKPINNSIPSSVILTKNETGLERGNTLITTKSDMDEGEENSFDIFLIEGRKIDSRQSLNAIYDNAIQRASRDETNRRTTELQSSQSINLIHKNIFSQERDVVEKQKILEIEPKVLTADYDPRVQNLISSSKQEEVEKSKVWTEARQSLSSIYDTIIEKTLKENMPESKPTYSIEPNKKSSEEAEPTIENIKTRQNLKLIYEGAIDKFAERPVKQVESEPVVDKKLEQNSKLNDLLEFEEEEPIFESVNFQLNDLQKFEEKAKANKITEENPAREMKLPEKAEAAQNLQTIYENVVRKSLLLQAPQDKEGKGKETASVVNPSELILGLNDVYESAIRKSLLENLSDPLRNLEKEWIDDLSAEKILLDQERLVQQDPKVEEIEIRQELGGMFDRVLKKSLVEAAVLGNSADLLEENKQPQVQNQRISLEIYNNLSALYERIIPETLDEESKFNRFEESKGSKPLVSEVRQDLNKVYDEIIRKSLSLQYANELLVKDSGNVIVPQLNQQLNEVSVKSTEIESRQSLGKIYDAVIRKSVQLDFEKRLNLEEGGESNNKKPLEIEARQSLNQVYDAVVHKSIHMQDGFMKKPDSRPDDVADVKNDVKASQKEVKLDVRFELDMIYDKACSQQLREENGKNFHQEETEAECFSVELISNERNESSLIPRKEGKHLNEEESVSRTSTTPLEIEARQSLNLMYDAVVRRSINIEGEQNRLSEKIQNENKKIDENQKYLENYISKELQSIYDSACSQQSVEDCGPEIVNKPFCRIPDEVEPRSLQLEAQLDSTNEKNKEAVYPTEANSGDLSRFVSVSAPLSNNKKEFTQIPEDNSQRHDQKQLEIESRQSLMGIYDAVVRKSINLEVIKDTQRDKEREDLLEGDIELASIIKEDPDPLYERIFKELDVEETSKDRLEIDNKPVEIETRQSLNQIYELVVRKSINFEGGVDRKLVEENIKDKFTVVQERELVCDIGFTLESIYNKTCNQLQKEQEIGRSNKEKALKSCEIETRQSLSHIYDSAVRKSTILGEQTRLANDIDKIELAEQIERKLNSIYDKANYKVCQDSIKPLEIEIRQSLTQLYDAVLQNNENNCESKVISNMIKESCDEIINKSLAIDTRQTLAGIYDSAVRKSVNLGIAQMDSAEQSGPEDKIEVPNRPIETETRQSLSHVYDTGVRRSIGLEKEAAEVTKYLEVEARLSLSNIYDTVIIQSALLATDKSKDTQDDQGSEAHEEEEEILLGKDKLSNKPLEIETRQCLTQLYEAVVRKSLVNEKESEKISAVEILPNSVEISKAISIKLDSIYDKAFKQVIEEQALRRLSSEKLGIEVRYDLIQVYDKVLKSPMPFGQDIEEETNVYSKVEGKVNNELNKSERAEVSYQLGNLFEGVIRKSICSSADAQGREGIPIISEKEGEEKATEATLTEKMEVPVHVFGAHNQNRIEKENRMSLNEIYDKVIKKSIITEDFAIISEEQKQQAQLDITDFLEDIYAVAVPKSTQPSGRGDASESLLDYDYAHHNNNDKINIDASAEALQIVDKTNKVEICRNSKNSLAIASEDASRLNPPSFALSESQGITQRHSLPGLYDSTVAQSIYVPSTEENLNELKARRDLIEMEIRGPRLYEPDGKALTQSERKDDDDQRGININQRVQSEMCIISSGNEGLSMPPSLRQQEESEVIFDSGRRSDSKQQDHPIDLSQGFIKSTGSNVIDMYKKTNLATENDNPVSSLNEEDIEGLPTCKSEDFEDSSRKSSHGIIEEREEEYIEETDSKVFIINSEPPVELKETCENREAQLDLKAVYERVIRKSIDTGEYDTKNENSLLALKAIANMLEGIYSTALKKYALGKRDLSQVDVADNLNTIYDNAVRKSILGDEAAQKEGPSNFKILESKNNPEVMSYLENIYLTVLKRITEEPLEIRLKNSETEKALISNLRAEGAQLLDQIYNVAIRKSLNFQEETFKPVIEQKPSSTMQAEIHSDLMIIYEGVLKKIDQTQILERKEKVVDLMSFDTEEWGEGKNEIIIEDALPTSKPEFTDIFDSNREEKYTQVDHTESLNTQVTREEKPASLSSDFVTVLTIPIPEKPVSSTKAVEAEVFICMQELYNTVLEKINEPVNDEKSIGVNLKLNEMIISNEIRKSIAADIATNLGSLYDTVFQQNERAIYDSSVDPLPGEALPGAEEFTAEEINQTANLENKQEEVYKGTTILSIAVPHFSESKAGKMLKTEICMNLDKIYNFILMQACPKGESLNDAISHESQGIYALENPESGWDRQAKSGIHQLLQELYTNILEKSSEAHQEINKENRPSFIEKEEMASEIIADHKNTSTVISIKVPEFSQSRAGKNVDTEIHMNLSDLYDHVFKKIKSLEGKTEEYVNSDFLKGQTIPILPKSKESFERKSVSAEITIDLEKIYEKVLLKTLSDQPLPMESESLKGTDEVKPSVQTSSANISSPPHELTEESSTEIDRIESTKCGSALNSVVLQIPDFSQSKPGQGLLSELRMDLHEMYELVFKKILITESSAHSKQRGENAQCLSTNQSILADNTSNSDLLPNFEEMNMATEINSELTQIYESALKKLESESRANISEEKNELKRRSLNLFDSEETELDRKPITADAITIVSIGIPQFEESAAGKMLSAELRMNLQDLYQKVLCSANSVVNTKALIEIEGKPKTQIFEEEKVKGKSINLLDSEESCEELDRKPITADAITIVSIGIPQFEESAAGKMLTAELRMNLQDIYQKVLRSASSVEITKDLIEIRVGRGEAKSKTQISEEKKVVVKSINPLDSEESCEELDRKPITTDFITIVSIGIPQFEESAAGKMLSTELRMNLQDLYLKVLSRASKVENAEEAKSKTQVSEEKIVEKKKSLNLLNSEESCEELDRKPITADAITIVSIGIPQFEESAAGRMLNAELRMNLQDLYLKVLRNASSVENAKGQFEIRGVGEEAKSKTQISEDKKELKKRSLNLLDSEETCEELDGNPITADAITIVSIGIPKFEESAAGKMLSTELRMNLQDIYQKVLRSTSSAENTNGLIDIAVGGGEAKSETQKKLVVKSINLLDSEESCEELDRKPITADAITIVSIGIPKFEESAAGKMLSAELRMNLQDLYLKVLRNVNSVSVENAKDQIKVEKKRSLNLLDSEESCEELDRKPITADAITIVSIGIPQFEESAAGKMLSAELRMNLQDLYLKVLRNASSVENAKDQIEIGGEEAKCKTQNSEDKKELKKRSLNLLDSEETFEELNGKPITADAITIVSIGIPQFEESAAGKMLSAELRMNLQDLYLKVLSSANSVEKERNRNETSKIQNSEEKKAEKKTSINLLDSDDSCEELDRKPITADAITIVSIGIPQFEESAAGKMLNAELRMNLQDLYQRVLRNARGIEKGEETISETQISEEKKVEKKRSFSLLDSEEIYEELDRKPISADAVTIVSIGVPQFEESAAGRMLSAELRMNLQDLYLKVLRSTSSIENPKDRIEIRDEGEEVKEIIRPWLADLYESIASKVDVSPISQKRERDYCAAQPNQMLEFEEELIFKKEETQFEVREKKSLKQNLIAEKDIELIEPKEEKRGVFEFKGGLLEKVSNLMGRVFGWFNESDEERPELAEININLDEQKYIDGERESRLSKEIRMDLEQIYKRTSTGLVNNEVTYEEPNEEQDIDNGVKNQKVDVRLSLDDVYSKVLKLSAEEDSKIPKENDIVKTWLSQDLNMTYDRVIRCIEGSNHTEDPVDKQFDVKPELEDLYSNVLAKVNKNQGEKLIWDTDRWDDASPRTLQKRQKSLKLIVAETILFLDSIYKGAERKLKQEEQVQEKFSEELEETKDNEGVKGSDSNNSILVSPQSMINSSIIFSENRLNKSFSTKEIVRTSPRISTNFMNVGIELENLRKKINFQTRNSVSFLKRASSSNSMMMNSARSLASARENRGFSEDNFLLDKSNILEKSFRLDRENEPMASTIDEARGKSKESSPLEMRERLVKAEMRDCLAALYDKTLKDLINNQVNVQESDIKETLETIYKKSCKKLKEEAASNI